MVKISDVIRIDKRCFRVIHAQYNQYILIDIYENRMPFLQDVYEGEYEIIDYTEKLFTSIESLSDKELHQFEKNRKIIDEISKKLNVDGIIDKKLRRQTIKEIAFKNGVSQRQIQDTWIKYLKNASNVMALVPRYKRKRVSNAGEKRGRKGRKEGIAIDENISMLFDSVIKKWYFSDVYSLKYCYERMLLEHFAKNTGDDGKVELVEKYPSLNQWYYYFNKHYSGDARIIEKRFGEVAGKQHARALLGSVKSDRHSYSVEMDSTILDMHTVTKHGVVGRPILYTLVEPVSQKLIFCYITLENWLSETSAMNTLLYSICFQKEYYQLHGISCNGDMDGYVPDKLVIDRGEFKQNDALEELISSKLLSMTLNYTSAYRGELKSIVENMFNKLNIELSKFVDGKVVKAKHLNKRTKQDTRLTASCEVSDILRIVYLIMNEYNENHVVKSFNNLDYTGNYTPNSIFNFRLQYYGIHLRKADKRQMLMLLLPSGNARVTEKGIKFKHLFYINDIALREKWIENARLTGTYVIKVKYYSNDASRIYFYDDKNKGIYELKLTKAYSDFSNMTFHEVDEFFRRKTDEINEQEEKALNSKLNMYNEIDKITKEAKKKKKKNSTNESNSKRLKDIKKNREIALREERAMHRELIRTIEETTNELDAGDNNSEEPTDDFLKLCERAMNDDSNS